MNIENAIDSFIEHQTGAGKSMRTLSQYRKTLKRFVNCVSSDEKTAKAKEVEDLTYEDFIRYRSWLVKTHQDRHGKNPSSSYIATEISTLVSFLKFCRSVLKVQLKNEDVNSLILDVRELRPKVIRPLPEYLEPWQVEQIIEKAETIEEKTLITVLFATGLRISELLNITEKNIHKTIASDGTEVLTLKVKGKGGKERIVPLNRVCRATLEKYIDYVRTRYRDHKTSDRLFRFSYSTAYRMIKESANKAGYRCHPHMLRHSFSTEVLAQTGEIRTLQELLGHSSLATTQIYTKVKDENKTVAVDSIRMPQR